MFGDKHNDLTISNIIGSDKNFWIIEKTFYKDYMIKITKQNVNCKLFRDKIFTMHFVKFIQKKLVIVTIIFMW